MKKVITLCILTSLCITGKMMAKEIELTSPDKNITLSVQLKDKICYSFTYGDEILLKECSLGMQIGKEQRRFRRFIQAFRTGVWLPQCAVIGRLIG